MNITRILPSLSWRIFSHVTRSDQSREGKYLMFSKLLYLFIHILRSISRHQIDLFGTITVMAQSCIVLKAVTRAILMHWLVGDKSRGVWGTYSVYNLHASGQCLPRFISCLPPASTLQQKHPLVVLTWSISVGNQIKTNQSELAAKPRKQRWGRENSESRLILILHLIG